MILLCEMISSFHHIGQVSCLSQPEVLLGGNLVYTAPTSGGKTLISEILMIRHIMKFRHRTKVLFILPYVSIVTEKVAAFGKLYSTHRRKTTIRAKAFHSGSSSSVHGKTGNKKGLREGGGGLRGFLFFLNLLIVHRECDLQLTSFVDVAVCTIEKANGILNRMLEDGSLSCSFS